MPSLELKTEAIPYGVQFGLLHMRGLTPGAPPTEMLREECLAALRRRYGTLDRQALKALPTLKAYNDCFRRFGRTYPVLAQLESVLRGEKSLDAASGVLQAMFATELETLLLTAGHDVRALRPPLWFGTAAGESYETLSGRKVTTLSGDLMLRDHEGVLSSMMWGPDFRTRLNETTDEALFTVYAPPGIAPAEVEEGLARLESRLRSFSPEAAVELRQVLSV